MGPSLEIEKFSRFTLLGPRFFFRGRDINNGEILFASQKYKAPLQRNRTAARLARLMRCPISSVEK